MIKSWKENIHYQYVGKPLANNAAEDLANQPSTPTENLGSSGGVFQIGKF